MSPKRASIDCGTNSFRLLVVDEALEPIAHELIITRLGERVHETRALQPAAVARSVAALEHFKAILDHHDVPPGLVRAAATSAARDATNGEAFLDAAAEALGGTTLEILSGDEEAATTFRGVASNGISGPMLVVDIGGGSTELAFGIDGDMQWAKSLDVGSVRLTELALHSDPFTSAELAAATRRIGEMLTTVDFTTMPSSTTLIGVAGSTTSLAAIAIGVDQWKPGCVDDVELGRARLDAVLDRLSTMTNAQRCTIPTLVPGRADVIVAGGLVLREVMDASGLEVCRISERDLLFGLLVDR